MITIEIDGITGEINALADGGYPFSDDLRAAMQASWQFPDGDAYLRAVIAHMGRGRIVGQEESNFGTIY